MALTIQQVNHLPYEEFTEKFGNIIEHCPVLMAAVWDSKPFQDIIHLHGILSRTIDSLPLPVKAGIIRCHPDLAGRLAEQGALTEESKQEQKAAALDTLTQVEQLSLQLNNQRYKEKFGFPFVIVARENKKETIMKKIVSRYDNSREQEIATAIEEIKTIGLLRLKSFIEGDSKL